MPDLTTPPVQYLTIRQAAELLGVNPKTLRRWEASNLVHPHRNRLNQRVYSLSEIQLLKDRKYKPVNSQPLAPDNPTPIPVVTPQFPKTVNKVLPMALSPLLSLIPFALVVLPILLFILFGYKPSLPLSNLDSSLTVNQLETSPSSPSAQSNSPVLSRVPRGEVAGVTVTGGSLLSFENVLDDNYNFGVAGTVEGNQLISATTVKPPLVVASRELVANLNADLLDGHSWEEIQTTTTSPSTGLQGAYDAGNNITTTGQDILFTLSGIDQLSIGGSGSVIFSQSGGTSFTNPVTMGNDLQLDGDLISNQSSFDLLNSDVSTINLGGQATSLNLGASSGTTTIKNTLSIAGSLTSTDTISIRPNSDNDDYVYISTTSDQPGIFFAGATSSNDPGFRVNSSTGRLEFRESGSSTWNVFGSGSSATVISDGGSYLYPTGRESVRIYDASGVDFLDIAHDGTNVILTTNGTTEVRLDNDLQISGNINPSVNNTYDLGNTTNRFREIFATTVNATNLTLNGTTISSFTAWDQNSADDLVLSDILNRTFWQQNNQQLSPKNSTFDILTGGISTDSATFYAQGITGNGYFAGNLGIGTTDPQTRLNLSDTGTYTFASGGLSFGDGDTGLFESSDDVLVAHTGGADRYVLSSSTSTITSPDLTIGTS